MPFYTAVPFHNQGPKLVDYVFHKSRWHVRGTPPTYLLQMCALLEAFFYACFDTFRTIKYGFWKINCCYPILLGGNWKFGETGFGWYISQPLKLWFGSYQIWRPIYLKVPQLFLLPKSKWDLMEKFTKFFLGIAAKIWHPVFLEINV
jgi:hypothetical protein